MQQDNINYMRRALSLARRGAGRVSPNPLVGAVLVKKGKIIGEGYHARYGSAHAEINALESASSPVKGATLYCTLEPCSHTNKKTSPCAQRIVREGISKVFIGSLDPNPMVNGKGVSLLREAGIQVEHGILARQNVELNRFYFKHIVSGLPYVTVKIAQTLDGKISKKRTEQNWLTGTMAQRKVHKWRSVYDAILVGGNTIRVDDPQLNVRLVSGRNPLRVIISASLNLPLTAQVFKQDKTNKTIVYTGYRQTGKMDRKEYEFIELLSDEQGLLSLKDVLADLGRRGIASVLVEGGQEIFSQFIYSDLADEVAVFVVPEVWGSGVTTLDNGPELKLKIQRVQALGDDVLLIYRRQ